MKKLDLTIFIIMFLVILSAFYYQDTVTSRKKEDLVIFVDAAVQLVESEGEEAFPDFYTDQWIDGDLYIFIWQLDGVRLVYPPDPEAVNQDMSNLLDYEGKPIGNIFIETAIEGDGWVEYMWPKPGEMHPSPKLTYIKRADYEDSSYLVGAGVYI